MGPIAARYLVVLRVSPALVGSVTHANTGSISAPGVRLGASFLLLLSEDDANSLTALLPHHAIGGASLQIYGLLGLFALARAES